MLLKTFIRKNKSVQYTLLKTAIQNFTKTWK